jgi:isopentenyl-diphosphate delta-isomerase
MSEKLILVDSKDKFLDLEDKWECHKGEGLLHRAFSVFVFDSKKKLLIQQRSMYKPLWPFYWSGTCCSHPRENESYFEAAERRLFEECGFSCDLEFLYKFQYQAKFKDVGSENELCAVLIGRSDAFPLGNPEEVAAFEKITLENLQRDIMSHPYRYTPWFKMEIEELVKNYIDRINGFFYN